MDNFPAGPFIAQERHGFGSSASAPVGASTGRCRAAVVAPLHIPGYLPRDNACPLQHATSASVDVRDCGALRSSSNGAMSMMHLVVLSMVLCRLSVQCHSAHRAVWQDAQRSAHHKIGMSRPFGFNRIGFIRANMGIIIAARSLVRLIDRTRPSGCVVPSKSLEAPVPSIKSARCSRSVAIVRPSAHAIKFRIRNACIDGA